jgi:hypothetical protein
MQNRFMPIFVLAAALLTASPAGAHTSGYTYEATVNNYFIDIGSSKPTFIPNEMVLFEYNIYATSDPNNLADFNNVYVTVADEKGVQLAAFVHRPGDMLTVLSYAFPKAGDYTMSARFQKDTAVMAEVSFPIKVGEGSASSARAIKVIALALIVLAAIGSAYAYMTRHKQVSP